MFDPAAADGLAARLEIRLGDHSFDARVADGRLEITRGAPAGPTP